MNIRHANRNQRQFRKLPKGPIGAKIRLKDYRWSTAVEQVVTRNLLSAFITDNAADDALLKRIMREVLRNHPFKPDTICSKFEVCYSSVSPKSGKKGGGGCTTFPRHDSKINIPGTTSKETKLGKGGGGAPWSPFRGKHCLQAVFCIANINTLQMSGNGTEADAPTACLGMGLRLMHLLHVWEWD